jgi:hypothetical protein
MFGQVIPSKTKNNFTATTAPTVNNDKLEGYKPGSIIYIPTTGATYLCVSNAEGAAVWRLLSGEQYLGVWNASTNSPTLADGTGVSSTYYIVSIGGTQNLGSGEQTFTAGDKVIYNGTIWQKQDGGTSYVPEDVANKENTTLDTSETKYPTNRLVKEQVDSKLPLAGGAMTGNLAFSGDSRRITGDLTNTTRLNRLLFQTTTADSNSNLGIIPSGTGRLGAFTAYGNPDADNASLLQVHADETNSHVGLNSSKTGGGTTKNLVLQIDGTTKAQINATTGALEMSSTAINEAAYATVASASTCNIGAAASNNVAISGTTPITSFGTADAGITRRCRATGAFLITYNATSLITKNGKNITTKADDCFTMTSLGSGNWIMTQFDPADGRALANAINNQTGTSYTLALTDIGNDVTLSNASAIALTIPLASGFPIGSTITVRNIGAGAVTSTKVAGSSDTVLGNTTLITGGVAIYKVISSTSWQIFAGTAVVTESFNIAFSGTLVNNQVYDIVVPNFNGTITGLSLRNTSAATAGTYTAKIDGTNITGLAAIANSTTRTLTAATAANTFTSGQVISYTPTGMTSVIDAFITINYTRNY